MLSKLSLYNFVQKIGFAMLCLYIFFSYNANGSFLPTIFNSLSLYLMVAFGFGAFVLSGKFKIGFSFFYLIFFAFSLFTIIYTDGSDWGGTIYQMFVTLVVCFAVEQLIINLKQFEIVLYAFSIAATTLTLYLVFSNRLNEDERLGTTIFGNANIFASLYMFAMLAIIWSIIFNKSKFIKLFNSIALVVNIYPMLLSGGRKYVIIPVIFAYILLLFKRDARGRSHIIKNTLLIGTITFAILFLIMNVPTLYHSIGYRMEYLINSFLGEGEIGASNTVRFSMIELAINAGFESPLLGHGFDSFKYLSELELGYYAYSHNNWTELFYNNGIVGIVVYYTFHILCIFMSLKKKNRHNPYYIFSIAFIFSICFFEYGCVTYFETLTQIFLCLSGINFTLSRNEVGYEQN